MIKCYNICRKPECMILIKGSESFCIDIALKLKEVQDLICKNCLIKHQCYEPCEKMDDKLEYILG